MVLAASDIAILKLKAPFNSAQGGPFGFEMTPCTSMQGT